MEGVEAGERILSEGGFDLAVAKDLELGRRFLEMAILSMGVSVCSFGVGYDIRQLFGIEI